jgi:PKD domain
VLTKPIDHAYAIGQTVTRTAQGLIPDGPQGQYVMVANMDQNGLEYPAYHWGTQHYLNDITGGTVGPWYTNINAVPLAPNGIYPATSDAWARITANMPNEVAFRNATQTAVSQAFQVLGQKYNFSIPLENPLRLDKVGSTPVDPSTQTVPAYTPADQAKYSPVVDDALGRTDQVSFINRGIPGFGIVGAYDSSSAAVGGFENPYPTNYTAKNSLGQYAGYDTNDDTIQHLNYWASGTTHGPGGVDQPSEALKRALELPATWTDYLIQQDNYGGAVAKGSDDVSYFETDPAKPTTTNTVTFDGSFSRGPDGSANGLKYFWDFGDGHTAASTNPKVTHTYASTMPAYYDVRLYTLDPAGHVGYYRQALPVEFQPTQFPATPPAGEPAPPSTDPCGTLTGPEKAFITGLAGPAFAKLGNGTTEVDGTYTTQPGTVTGNVPATLSLSLSGPASFGSFIPGQNGDYSATLTANVVSSAGDGALTVSDPSTTATGHLVNGAFSLPSALTLGGVALPAVAKTYSGPVSNDAVPITFGQHIGSTDPLRTGSYSKTLTFTLSTTMP